MTQRDRDVAWIKSYVGAAFVRGVGIRGRTAVIVVKGEGGEERETIISLPEK